nr:RNA-directed DNA polymerase, eukaryota, reverse transcriptase zinc-binding domain protein [Tanacetum cinerariifolium]
TQDDVYPVEDAGSLFLKKLDMDKAIDLIRHVVDNEIKDAMFSIDDNKATGPDGYSFKFFKAEWSIIGKDICSATKEFFSSFKMLCEFNTTLISLVPKLKSPARVTDYRPISRGLDEFSMSSGLYLSEAKSEAFFSGLTPKVKEEIKLVMPFREGTLPIRYLGVPLSSKNINKNDCRVLVEVVQNKGSLGLRPLHDWNEALMAKHLWNIASNKDSI